MGGNGFWETVQLFHDALQAAVARATPAILQREGPYPPSESRGRLYLSAPKAPLGRGEGHLSVSIALRFRVEPSAVSDDRWEIQTFAYSYLLFRDDHEIVAYHWDHEGVSVGAVRTPHVHIGKDLAHPGMRREDRDRLDALAAAHMPTGTMPFTAILRTAMRDLGADPLLLQGESVEEAKVSAERSFTEAEAVLMASFDWSRRQAHIA